MTPHPLHSEGDMKSRPLMLRMIPALLTVAVLSLTVACGGGAPALDLPPEAEEGRRLYVNSGCAGCHGRLGEGGIGPTVVGIRDTPRPLMDGTTVIADQAYLIRAIMDPHAELVEGYSLRMPTNRLDESQVRAILTFLDALDPREDRG